MSFQDRHVKDVYNEIATHFSATRAYTWSGIYSFINNLDKNTDLLEIGCGNGKNLTIRDDIYSTGLDISHQMSTICNQKGLEVMVGDCSRLPFRTNSFNASISVAVIHHLDSVNKRHLALQEQIRVTRPGGLIFLQVWGNGFTRSDQKFIPVENGDPDDYLVRWQKHDGKKYYRYYHLFSESEFIDLVHAFSNVTVVKKFYEHDNWGAILKVNNI